MHEFLLPTSEHAPSTHKRALPMPECRLPTHGYTLSRVSDDVLLRDLTALVASDRLTTARILAHIAEVDARRLYAPAGYPSMFAFCVEELRLSEDAAYKRIRAARAARRFPALFVAVAEGRLHLAAVCLLAPHLTVENVEELIQAATHRPKSEIETMLARRFPVEGAPVPSGIVRAISCPPHPQLAPGQLQVPRARLNWPRGQLQRLRATTNLPWGKLAARRRRLRRFLRPSATCSSSRSGRPRMKSSATPRPS
jgi:hypothetical protein